MLGWMKNKAQKSRVYSCIKVCKWDIESADIVKRAKILAITSALGKECFSGSGIPIDVVDRPLDYSSDDLMEVYVGLENIRNKSIIQIEHIKKMMGKYGIYFPSFAEDHAKLTSLALEVWMATVGAGIATERRDDVRTVWKLLVQSKPFLDEAMDALLEIEQKFRAMTGRQDEMFSQQDEMFSRYERDFWKKACDFLPSQFSKELNLE